MTSSSYRTASAQLPSNAYETAMRRCAAARAAGVAAPSINFWKMARASACCPCVSRRDALRLLSACGVGGVLPCAASACGSTAAAQVSSSRVGEKRSEVMATMCEAWRGGICLDRRFRSSLIRRADAGVVSQKFVSEVPVLLASGCVENPRDTYGYRSGSRLATHQNSSVLLMLRTSGTPH